MFKIDGHIFDTWAELVEYLSTIYPEDALAAQQQSLQTWGKTTEAINDAHLLYVNGVRDYGTMGNLYFDRGWMDESYNLSQGFYDAVNVEYTTPEWASLGLPRSYAESDFAGKTYQNIGLQLGGSAETSGGSITTMSSTETSGDGATTTITKVMEVVKEEDPLNPGTFSYVATLQALGWLPLPTWTAAVAPALGAAVGYGMYDLNPEFWDGLAQKLAPYSYHDLTAGNVLRDIIRLPIIYDPRTQTVLTSLKLIEALKDFFIEEGVYTESTFEPSDPPETEITIYYADVENDGTLRDEYSATVNPTLYSNSLIVIQKYDISQISYQPPARPSRPLDGFTEYLTGQLLPDPLIVIFAYDNYVIPVWTERPSTTGPIGIKAGDWVDYNGRLRKYRYNDKTVWIGCYIRSNNYIVPVYPVVAPLMDAYALAAFACMYASTTGGVPGLTPEPGATYPTDTDTIPEIYPNWADSSRNILTDPTADNFEDGTEEFYPISLSDTNNSTNTDDTTSTKDQQEAQNGDNSDPSQLTQILEAILDLPQTIIDTGLLNPDVPSNPPESENTPTPNPPVITGAGSDLIAIYNPTKSELQAFNQFLWSLDPTQLVNWKKVIQNPIDAIISLHMIYVTPSTGSSQNIKCGYIETNVPAKVVTNQYVDVDCGSVTLSEFFGNVWDYIATEVQLFLPFIGIVSLNTYDVMNSSINVKYRIDVYTGTCLAQVIVTKEGTTACLYTFAGNCSVELPLSGGSFSVIASSLITLATSAVAGGVSGAVSGIVSEGISYAKGQRKQSISRSGNISANAGAMGIRTPYLIITRNKPLDAYQYQTQYGYPANITISLGSIRGYTRVKAIHLSGIPCTDDELEMIESLLKEGVIIN